MADAPQTVFVVDDDAALRDAVATLLTAEGHACETYPDTEAFLARMADWPPEASGCVILDVRMPGASGLVAQDELSARGISLPVVFVTGHGDVPSAVRAMRGGALDFLCKPFDAQALSARVREGLRLDAKRCAARRELEAIRARAATLSERERQVFERVAAGQANKRVAIDLGVSERTVEIHRSHLMKKMGARNVAGLVRLKMALERGAGPQGGPGG